MAIPIGVLSATYQNSFFDKVTTVLVFVGFAVPHFWLALLLMILFGVHLGWLPISGLKSLNYEYLPFSTQIWDRVSHLILPIFISASGGLAGLSRYMRSNMLEVIRQDYITTARSKGLSNRTVIFKHALRNALLPVITILGLSIPGLIGGSVIFETIFAIPGMGQLFYTQRHGPGLSDDHGYPGDRSCAHLDREFDRRCILCAGRPENPGCVVIQGQGDGRRENQAGFGDMIGRESSP